MSITTSTERVATLKQKVESARNRRKLSVYDAGLLDQVLSTIEYFDEEKFTEEYALCLRNGLILEHTRTANVSELTPYCKDGAYIVRCMATPWMPIES